MLLQPRNWIQEHQFADILDIIARHWSCSFGIWSDSIKKQYHLSQLQVAGIGTAGNIGGYMAIFAGLLYDWLRGMNRYAWKLAAQNCSKQAPQYRASMQSPGTCQRFHGN